MPILPTPLVPAANNPQSVGRADALVSGGLTVFGTSTLSGGLAVGTASTMGTPATPLTFTDGDLISPVQMVGSKAFIRVVTTAGFLLPSKFIQITPDPALGPSVNLIITPLESNSDVNQSLVSFQTYISPSNAVLGQIESNAPIPVPPATRLPTNRLFSVVCV
jgi:hypothetical protein